jgi:EpsD family peptidyl-prolyl cis-trans isomerase
MIKAFRLISGLSRFLLAGCFFVCISSCDKKKTEQQASGAGVIAKVYDRELTLAEIRNIVPNGVSRSDSLTIIRTYVDHWIRQQVVLRKAEDNLDEDAKDVTKELEEYRNSLITYQYERQLIRQELDTAVSEEEIEKYYHEHESNFKLRNNIVQVSYFRLPVKAPKIEKVRNWYKSSQPRDRKLLEEYCYQFATDYYFNDQDWMPFEELQKKVPVETYSQEQFLRSNRHIELLDSTHLSFLIIKGFKIKESLSPLSFERENIRNLIINRRKLDLIAIMEKAAYEKAVEENQVENFLKKDTK